MWNKGTRCYTVAQVYALAMVLIMLYAVMLGAMAWVFAEAAWDTLYLWFLLFRAAPVELRQHRANRLAALTEAVEAEHQKQEQELAEQIARLPVPKVSGPPATNPPERVLVPLLCNPQPVPKTSNHAYCGFQYPEPKAPAPPTWTGDTYQPPMTQETIDGLTIPRIL